MLELSIGITAYRQLKWDPLNASSAGAAEASQLGAAPLAHNLIERGN